MRTLVAVLLFAAIAAPSPAAAQFIQILDGSRPLFGSDATPGHPDASGRTRGIAAYRRGDLEGALRGFRYGARHADKASQAMLAQMYWHGEGVARDRATAYAWMDLAAERGYPQMLAQREAFWSRLDEDERARALRVGVAIYAEYGDDVAKGRQERAMERERRTQTGSRTGALGNLQVMVATDQGLSGGNGTTFYAEERWSPAAYWRAQDEHWMPRGDGEVSIGDVEAAHAEDAVDDEAPPRR